MKRLIYLLLVMTLVVSCNKDEEKEPETKKISPIILEEDFGDATKAYGTWQSYDPNEDITLTLSNYGSKNKFYMVRSTNYLYGTYEGTYTWNKGVASGETSEGTKLTITFIPYNNYLMKVKIYIESQIYRPITINVSMGRE